MSLVTALSDELVVQHLAHNEAYGRRVIAFLKPEYFKSQAARACFLTVRDYVDAYNAFPSHEALALELSVRRDLGEEEYKEAVGFVSEVPDEKTSLEWLVDKTEEFCKNRALQNAILTASTIVMGKSKDLAEGSIPQLLSDALAVSFDTRLGHDYFEDAEKQWEWMHEVTNRIPFHIDILNKATRGGIPADCGFLMIFLAGTNGGKSMTMCDFAANHLMDGKNVLYITLEMDEPQIIERIDANLMDVAVNDLVFIQRDRYVSKHRELKKRTQGKLVVRKFPGGVTSCDHVRHLLQELKLKKKFTPDIVYVDYIGEMASSRVKMDGNSYNYVKSIASELRGLSDQWRVPIISAMQTNRSGLYNTDINMSNVADSVGVPFVADLMIGLVQTEELAKLGQMLFLLLKARTSDKTKYGKFLVGVDVPKMQYFDLEDVAQKGLNQGAAQAAADDFESKTIDFT